MRKPLQRRKINIREPPSVSLLYTTRTASTKGGAVGVNSPTVHGYRLPTPTKETSTIRKLILFFLITVIVGVLILSICGSDTRESLEQNVWSMVHLGGDVHHHTGPVLPTTAEEKSGDFGKTIRGALPQSKIDTEGSHDYEEKILYVPHEEGTEDITTTTTIATSTNDEKETETLPETNENTEKEKPEVKPQDQEDGGDDGDDDEKNAQHTIKPNESIDRQKIQEIRNEFYSRYGGKEEATSMLQRGIERMTTDEGTNGIPISHTAERILRAKQQSDRSTFTMAFGGYSVTVGRGNHFKQSYPFIMQEVLKPIFEEYFHLDLVVRNSAIGGIPSFPYGFCLPNFLGDDADVVSWDYGMNEGNGAEAFEAYVRQSISTLSKRPMMIMLDTKRPRIKLLQSYFENEALLDSIAVGRGEIVKKEFLEMSETERPKGFQKWNEWGAPKGSPGQSPWHPKKMEHELIGWILAMHFLDAVEVALDKIEAGNDAVLDATKHQKLDLLPDPVSSIKGSSEATIPHILHGTKVGTSDGSWHMNPISCRTSFIPNIDGNMGSIILSGVTPDDGDTLKTKPDEDYEKGWVVDVGKVERETKQKVEAKGGLGYIDMKLALYGISASGPLKLWLPYEGQDNLSPNNDSREEANELYDSLVFCEVNEKRGDDECKMDSDIKFIVGGVESKSIVQITSVAAYLRKAICVNVIIPSGAKVSTRKDAIEKNSAVEAFQSAGPDTDVGVEIEITVDNQKVTREDGACSISHVVWQSKH